MQGARAPVLRCWFSWQARCHRYLIGIASAAGKGAASTSSSQPEYTLLVLDPGCPSRPLAEALARRQGWQRMVKRGQHTLRKPQYQLLYCAPGLARPAAAGEAQGAGGGGAEWEALKTVAASEWYR